MMQAKCGRQHGLEPDCPIGSLAEGQALGVDVLRIMRGDDDVDLAPSPAHRPSPCVVFRAQRRIELEEGPVLADVVFVEAQVIDRDAAGDLGATLRATWIASTDSGTEICEA